MKSALDSVMARKKQQGGGGIGGTASAAPSARPSLSSMPASVLNAVEHTVADGGGAPSDEETLEGRALCIFGPHSGLRAALAAAIWHPRFEQAVIVLICLSSITLALDSPRLDPEGRTKHVLVRAPPAHARPLTSLYAVKPTPACTGSPQKPLASSWRLRCKAVCARQGAPRCRRLRTSASSSCSPSRRR